MKTKRLVVDDVDVSALKPHPRNYRQHPDDQIEHIAQSIKQHGVYRNIVAAKDLTILAGHGVVLAALKLGIKTLRVVKLPIAADSPAALKLLAGDNEIGKLAVVDDRALSQLLKDVGTLDEYGLVGTGFDAMMLANLVMVTRPASEVADINEAAEWLGLPNYQPKVDDLKYVVLFRNDDERKRFAEKFGLRVGTEGKRAWSVRWPDPEKEDLSSVRYE